MSNVAKLQPASPDAPITGPHVYAAIADVMAALSKDGIAKDRTGTGINYSFRGVDDVYNALSSVLAENRLCVIPRVINRECLERKTSNGKPVLYTVVEAEFDLVSAVDGSKHTARTVGEAMDFGDKSANKAMSAAYKYMAFQTFCIPTQGDNDADATTHELAPDTSGAFQAAKTLLQGITHKGVFAEAWGKNKDGWKAVLSTADYIALVDVMKACAAKLSVAEPKPAPAPRAEDVILDDEIPF